MKQRKPHRQASTELRIERDRLSKLKVEELKKQCTTAGLPKCYRKRKVDLVRELAKKSVPVEKHFALLPAPGDELAKMTVKQLQAKCQELGISQCYIYRPKAHLVGMLREYLTPKPSSVKKLSIRSKSLPPNAFANMRSQSQVISAPPVAKDNEEKEVKPELTKSKSRVVSAGIEEKDKESEAQPNLWGTPDFAPIDPENPFNEGVTLPGEDVPAINTRNLPANLGEYDEKEVKADPGLLGQYGDRWSEIGSGNFGQIYKAYDSRTKTTVVLKRMSKSEVNSDDFQTEVNILQQLEKHCNPYFVCYINTVQTNDDRYIIMEFLGDYIPLDQYIKEVNDQLRTRDWSMIRQIIKNMLQAMHVLFNIHAINHRDINPNNIMVNVSFEHKGAIKVIDFGKSCSSKACNSFESEGTPLYLAPELAVRLLSADEKATLTPKSIHQADVWSLGMTIWELVTGVTFDEAFENQVSAEVIAAHFKQLNPRISEAYLQARAPDSGQIPFFYELMYMTLIPAARLKDVMNKLWFAYADKTMPPEIYSDLRRIFLSCVEQNPSKRKLIQLT